MDHQTLPDHDERMRVVEQVAGWHLGYSSWGAFLVGAYTNPDAALESLREEKAKWE